MFVVLGNGKALMEIAVLGGGNGAHAAAADLSEAGHRVRFWRRDDAEIARLSRQRDKLKLELGRCTKKLANENFVNNAPESVVRKERERLDEFEKTIAKLDDQLQVMEALERPD